MIAECRSKMRERELRRLFGIQPGRITEAAQRRADRALCFEKALPDSIGRGFAQAAVEITEGLTFVAGGHAVDEKRPQALSGQKQSCNLVGPPDAEGAPAAAGSVSIAAENPLSSHRFPAGMLIIIATEIPMANQLADAFAMRARRQLQLGQNCVEFRLSLTNSHATARRQSSPSTPAIVGGSSRDASAKTGAGYDIFDRRSGLAGCGGFAGRELAKLRV